MSRFRPSFEKKIPTRRVFRDPTRFLFSKAEFNLLNHINIIILIGRTGRVFGIPKRGRLGSKQGDEAIDGGLSVALFATDQDQGSRRDRAGEASIDAAGVRVDFAGERRQQRDAVADGDEFLNGLDLRASANDEGPAGFNSAERDDLTAEAVHFVEEDEGLSVEVLDGGPSFLGKGVFGGKSEEKLFLEQDFDFEAWVVDGQGEEGEGKIAAEASLDQSSGEVFGDQDGGGGKGASEFGGERGKQIRRDGRDRADVDDPAFFAGGIDDDAFGLLDRGQDGQGAFEEDPAGFGQLDHAAEAFEKRPAEFGFELDDLLAQRRLRDPAALGRLGEIRQVGGGDEVFQLVEFH